MPPKPDLTPRPRAEFVCDTAGSILSIRIRGEIDHHTAAAIRQGIDAILFEKRPAKLILDLSAVGFMDSSGLGLIMGRYSVMKELGGEMTVWNPSPETRAILTLAGMERLVRIAYPGGSPGQSPVQSPGRNPEESLGESPGRSELRGPSGAAKAPGRDAPSAPRRAPAPRAPRGTSSRKRKPQTEAGGIPRRKEKNA